MAQAQEELETTGAQEAATTTVAPPRERRSADTHDGANGAGAGNGTLDRAAEGKGPAEGKGSADRGSGDARNADARGAGNGAAGAATQYAQGVLEILPEGWGFLRHGNF